MPISERRFQMLLPASLKSSLEEAARAAGVSLGRYVRDLIEADRDKTAGKTGGKARKVHFPFGETPIHTGRTRGSVEHDRPER